MSSPTYSLSPDSCGPQNRPVSVRQLVPSRRSPQRNLLDFRDPDALKSRHRIGSSEDDQEVQWGGTSDNVTSIDKYGSGFTNRFKVLKQGGKVWTTEPG